ncbi:MAG: hypothetical protein AVDCRST_MAG93-5184 [uncultured Chloroflexia bacterium]|uniref:Uncharacterized protein n=1 Tax=uncultured Chloroflexia bacterium TaxID=1672391 RepID=A0A6J4KQ18_9CHLR|nr:MAG: hypothetical protein AVDCRST_MAG93-5184 [uncultured Chloroflexia bacterium]
MVERSPFWSGARTLSTYQRVAGNIGSAHLRTSSPSEWPKQASMRPEDVLVGIPLFCAARGVVIRFLCS